MLRLENRGNKHDAPGFTDFELNCNMDEKSKPVLFPRFLGAQELKQDRNKGLICT